MKNFNIEDQYNLYLKRVKLDETKMSVVQRNEMRRCFYGAFGQLLMLMQHEIVVLSEDEAIQVFEDMTKQVSEFFYNQTQN